MKNPRLLQFVVLFVFLTPVAYAPADDGFAELFDGKSLNNWDGDPKLWRVEDGVITGQTSDEDPIKHNTFLVYRGAQPSDFELRLKFRMFGGNSGVQFRSVEVDKWVISGYQGDFDATGKYVGILYEEKGRGILGPRGHKTVIGEDGKKTSVGTTTPDATIRESYQADEWNEFVVIAEGNKIVEKLNGQVTVEVTDNQADKRRMKGLIALQLHRGPAMKIQFKDIRLKDLSKKPQATPAPAPKKKVVLVAGRRSHGYGSHEHNAGCLLLARALEESVPQLETVVYQNGWPKEADAFDGADAVVIFCDGAGGHIVIPHLDQVDALASEGVGIGCIHFAVEVPKGKVGDKFLDWIGGYFELNWSVNPHWVAKFTSFPQHPVSNGLTPFEINDEWYYHMRFPEGMKGVTPILSAVAPPSTVRGDGGRSGNSTVRKAVQAGEPQHLCWVTERPDGGRGFGFTGGHWHWNWGNDNFRKVVLNAIVWVAAMDVPPSGVASSSPSIVELKANLDEPEPGDFKDEQIQKLFDEWQ